MYTQSSFIREIIPVLKKRILIYFGKQDFVLRNIDFYFEEGLSKLSEFEYISKQRISDERRQSFLYSTVRNLIIDDLRKQSRMAEYLKSDITIVDVPLSADNFEESTIEESMKTAIDSLPEKYSTVIYYKYFAKIPIAKIAEREGVTVICVKKRLKKAKELLKEYIKSYWDKFFCTLFIIPFVYYLTDICLGAFWHTVY
jgi:RNA polymerase sigma factor (sigma-70 family)